MTTPYRHLSSAERAMLQTMLAQGHRASQIARALGRHRSTISRELSRNGARRDPDTGARTAYDGIGAHQRARRLAEAPGVKKLEAGSILLDRVRQRLRESLSPEQVAGRLAAEHPDDPAKRVCHETIYTAIYAMPKGDLKTEVVACLRQRTGKRRPRSRGKDRARIADMTSIHLRPPEVADRVVPGHWEGDLIKGARNASAVGTLVERTTRLVKLVKMPGLSATSALAAFTRAFASIDGAMARTLTYDQGIEMARHRDFTAATGITVYFADPHSPWQRGTNENTNGLIRQYLPKGMDLASVTQAELDAIAHALNTRPRKVHKFRTPLEVWHGTGPGYDPSTDEKPLGVQTSDAARARD
jgi:transposase, IS30 family